MNDMGLDYKVYLVIPNQKCPYRFVFRSLTESTYKRTIELKMNPLESTQADPDDPPYHGQDMPVDEDFSVITHATVSYAKPSSETERASVKSTVVNIKTQEGVVTTQPQGNAMNDGMTQQKEKGKKMSRERKRVGKYSKEVSCAYCDFKSFYQNSVKNHERVHTGERPYKCDYCDKFFVNASSKRVHTAAHTGPQHQCPLCEKKFIQSGSLKEHMRKHTGERPFVCDFCGKAFSLNSNLTRHLRTHDSETTAVLASGMVECKVEEPEMQFMHGKQ